MRACIHRGARQIGGTCIELEARGKRVVLDLGLPLDLEPDESLLPNVDGLACSDASLLGVFITHAHRDHYGLLPMAAGRPRVFIGEAAARMLRAAGLFWDGAAGIGETEPLSDGHPVELGPFRVTPYLVDHSSYDAYALLVEAEGRCLFYSGDLRGHGRKRRLFEKLLRVGPKGCDVLLLEGTTLGRSEEASIPTEDDLERRLVAEFSSAAGLAFIQMSAMNVDRLVTVYRAARRTGRLVILDMYSAAVLRATGNPRVPQAEWEGVRVYLPRTQKRAVKAAGAFELARSFASSRIYPEDLAGVAKRAVMVFRPSMIRELEECGCLEGARLVYSLWSGYLERPETKPLLEWLERRGIQMMFCHTSGHASAADLRRLVTALEPRVVTPVHSDVPERYPDLWANTRQRADGEWFEVGGC